METLLELAKYTVPAIIVLIATSMVLKRFLNAEIRRSQLDIYKEGLKTTLPLRLQAYERFAVFVERIHPRTMVPRLYKSGMTVADLQYLMVATIKQEFEYNLSQQIYITDSTWKAVVATKEQLLGVVNQLASTLNPEASAKELHKVLMEFLLKSEKEFPINHTVDMIRKEAQLVLSQQAH